MRIRRLAFIFCLLVVGILLGIPLILVRRGGDQPPPAVTRRAPTAPSPRQSAAAPVAASPALAQDGEIPIAVFVNDRKELLHLGLDEYLKGVVAAEMPASFSLEALKAQAVVARTYAVNRMRVFGGQGCDAHPEADVCTDPAQGQAWLSRDDLRRRWGFLRFQFNWRRVELAVEGTRGQIAAFDGQPIDAVYHAASGGRTEDAVAVWGRPVPYLRSVASPYESAARYDGKKTRFSWRDLASRTGVPLERMEARRRQGLPVVRVVERSPSGRALRVQVAGTEFTGRDLRIRLGLPSTLLTVRATDDGVEIETSGYGHGVGMSQYGADGLARRGEDYRGIIRHFYQGAVVRGMFVE